MPLKRFFQSEAGATVLWVLSSLVVAAWLSPYLYEWGKSLAAAAAAKDLPQILEWLGGACQRAEFDRFYSRALAFAAVVLLPVLLKRIRSIRANQQEPVLDQVRLGWKKACLQIVVGALIAGGLLWGVGQILTHFGTFVAAPETPTLGVLLKKTLLPAIAVSLLEEWLFRGVLLGLWMKSARPLAACVGSSLFFAMIHFLKLPVGEVIVDPAGTWAGFQLLGKMIFHFTDPQFLIAEFATLFLVGMILAWARVKTGALWFSIGLHAGWIIAFKGFNLLHDNVPSHSVGNWGTGDTLRSGIVPWVALTATAGICHFAFRYFQNPQTASNRASR